MCRGPTRIVACITQPSVIDQILTHLPSRAAHAGARNPSSTQALCHPLGPRPNGQRGPPVLARQETGAYTPPTPI
jgi:hypothetical protein